MIMTICDLDGTICDDRHRLGLIDEAAADPFAAYHAACGQDRFINAGCVVTARSLVIITSRPESMRKETEAWLAAHNIQSSHLLMRPIGNLQPSPQLKEDLLLVLLRAIQVSWIPMAGLEFIAYDDRPDVLAMYRRHGMKTVTVFYED